MDYRNILAGFSKETPHLVYGTATGAVMGDDRAAAYDVLDRAWAAGFRMFDTAHTYGHAEENLGSWMAQRGVRDRLILIDKGHNPGQHGCPDVFGAATIREQVKESRGKLQTEHFEFYLLHRDDETKPVGEIVEVLNELAEAGAIAHFGVSNWRWERIMAAEQYAKDHGLRGFSAFSPSFSMADLANDLWGGSVTISGPENAQFRAWLRDTQFPVFPYSSLARGYLSGKYNPADGRRIEDCIGPVPIGEYDSPVNRGRLIKAFELAEKKGCTVPQICLAWVMQQGLNIYPMVSPTTDRHMADNLAALSVKLTEEEIVELTR